MQKYYKFIFALALVALFLMGCQQSPSQKVVTSKNDGKFEQNVQQTSPATYNTEAALNDSDVFSSTDGSVEFEIALNQTIETQSLPVIKVSPHYITGKDAQNVAQALFGDAFAYQKASASAPQFSRKQLQKIISALSPYSNQQAVKDLYGTTADMSEEIESIKRYISYCTEKLESAPTDNPNPPCDWTMGKDGYNNDVIFACIEYGDLEYEFGITSHNGDDYKLNEIYINLGNGIGPTTLKRILHAQLCRTPEPTAEQIGNAGEKGQEILDKLAFGQWDVYDTCVITEYFGDTPEYSILVKAYPRINGFAVIGGQNNVNLTGGNTFSSAYGLSSAEIQFNAYGDLVMFRLDSPIDIIETVNANVATLSVSELQDKAKTFLTLCDSKTNFGIPAGYPEALETIHGEKVVCKIEITQAEYGLSRVNVPNVDDEFYYLPAFVYKGTATYQGKDSGAVFQSTDQYGGQSQPLVWINAVDGSIIQ